VRKNFRKGVRTALPLQLDNSEAVENLLPYRREVFDGVQTRRGTRGAILKPSTTRFRIGRDFLTALKSGFRIGYQF